MGWKGVYGGVGKRGDGEKVWGDVVGLWEGEWGERGGDTFIQKFFKKILTINFLSYILALQNKRIKE